ncbi:hypothetical protein ACFO1V_00150 [Daeguia caeni]|uniref:Uncharacterized protein n=1 Tax=Daeguia caeni TaxID=439612 RepID=A0ABV9H2F6_9HYPH
MPVRPAALALAFALDEASRGILQDWSAAMPVTLATFASLMISQVTAWGPTR